MRVYRVRLGTRRPAGYPDETRTAGTVARCQCAARGHAPGGSYLLLNAAAPPSRKMIRGIEAQMRLAGGRWAPVRGGAAAAERHAFAGRCGGRPVVPATS